MKSRRIILAVGAIAVVIILFFVLSIFQSGRQAETLRQEAQDAFQSQQWQVAVEKYQEILTKEPENTTAIGALAEANFRLGNYRESLSYSQKLLSLEPGDKEAQVRIASSNYNLGNIGEACASFEQLSEIFPNNFEVRAGLASCLLERAQVRSEEDQATLLEQTREQVDKALALQPESPQALLVLAELQLIGGEIAEASSSAAIALSKDPDSVLAADIIGQVALAQGKYAQAEGMFNQALKLRKKVSTTVSASIRDHLGIAAYGQNKIQMAFDEWTQSSRIDPNYFPSLVHNGCLAQLRGQSDMAKEAFVAASALMGLQPGLPAVASKTPTRYDKQNLLTKMATLYLGLGQYSDAAYALEQLIGLGEPEAFVYYEYGNIQYIRGMLDDSLQSYQKAYKETPEDAAVAYNLGTLLLEQGSYSGAEEALKKAVELAPEDVDAHLNLGDVYFNSRRVTEALQLYEQVAHESETPGAYIRLGRAQEQLGNVSEAEAAYQKATQLDPDNSRAYLAQGLLRQEMRDAADIIKAQTALEKAVELDPQNDVIRTELGYVYLKQGKFAEAEEQFRVVLENPLYPSYAKAYNGLGSVYLAQDLYEKAEECFQTVKSRGKSGQVETAEMNLGNLAFRKGDYAKAREHYEAALLLRNDLPEGNYNLGCAYAKEDNWGRAAVEFQNCLYRNPKFDKAWYNLGIAFEKTGKPDRALEAYGKETGQARGLALLNRARLYNEAGDLKSAMEAVDGAEEAGEKTAEFHATRSNLLLRVGRAEEAAAVAREGLNKAMLADPEIQDRLTLQLHKTLGAALAFTKNWAESAEQFEWVLNKETADADARLNLGLAYASQGKTKEAMQMYQETTKVAPDDFRPYTYMGNMKLSQGEYAEARDLLVKSLRMNSNQPVVKQALEQIRDL